MKAINIDWDVDNKEELENLPTEIEIPDELKTDDEVSDYISDITGFCHRGYELVEGMVDDVKIRYYVCGIGYDENDHVTDYEQDLGDFDTYEEAYELFVKIQCRSVESFFLEAPKVYQLLIQLEECEEDDDTIDCIDVRNEWWITNPNFDKSVQL